MKPRPTEGAHVAVTTSGLEEVVGAPLRARRLALRHTQARLAALAGCGLTTIQVYEAGQVPEMPTPALWDLLDTLDRLEAEAGIGTP
jgi:hypothetical protein